MIDGKSRRIDNDESRVWVRQLGCVICVAGKKMEGVVNGKMMDSISDILGLRKM